MNCIDSHDLVDDYIQDELSDLKKCSMDSHINGCDDCARFLSERMHIVQALNNFKPIRAPQYLASRILGRKKSANYHIWKTGGFGAIAASVLAFVLYLGFFQADVHLDSGGGISAQLNSIKKVNFLVSSGRNLENVRFSVIVPPQLELSGYKGHGTLAWFGKLKQGNNLLSVPIIALDEQPGMLIMRIEHKEEIKEYKINVNAGRIKELSGFTMHVNA